MSMSMWTDVLTVVHLCFVLFCWSLAMKIHEKHINSCSFKLTTKQHIFELSIRLAMNVIALQLFIWYLRYWKAKTENWTGIPRCLAPSWSWTLKSKTVLLDSSHILYNSLKLLCLIYRVKAKKGVNLLSTRSKSNQWRVEWDVQSGAKHSIATVEASKIKGVTG